MKLARSPAAVANKQKYITIKDGNPKGDNKKYAVLVTIKKYTLCEYKSYINEYM